VDMNGTKENQKTQRRAQIAKARIGIGNEKHGMSRKRIYKIWAGMKSRCHNQKHASYKYYGAKGLSVCEEWRNSFLCFYDWATKNGYDDTLTIDRIDPNKGYHKSNCRWITREKNTRNSKKVRTISKAAIMAMKDNYPYWTTPEKENIRKEVFINLYLNGVCERRHNPYNHNEYQYILKN
jgi:hypothetical protein